MDIFRLLFMPSQVSAWFGWLTGDSVLELQHSQLSSQSHCNTFIFLSSLYGNLPSANSSPKDAHNKLWSDILLTNLRKLEFLSVQIKETVGVVVFVCSFVWGCFCFLLLLTRLSLLTTLLFSGCVLVILGGGM